MNLRELLLEFAGKNSLSLEIEELLVNNFKDLIVFENTGELIKLKTNDSDINKSVKDISKFLKKNKYEVEVLIENDNILVKC